MRVWAWIGASGGIVLIAAVCFEVFQDLFHPTHGGALTDWIGRTLFRLCKRIGMLPLAGPLSIVTVIAAWVVLLIVGFTLVYMAGYPGSFRTNVDVPLPPNGFPTALYFSFETLITLGYGDIVPQSSVMRLVASVEGLVGFALLTASVSSLVLLYPALSRTRLLARGVAHLVAAEARTGVPIGNVPDCVFAALTRDVTSARVDLIHFPITYYFATSDDEASVAYWLPSLARLAQTGLAAERNPSTRLVAGGLDDALTELGALLAERFLRIDGGDRDEVFRAVAADHAVVAARGAG